MRPFLVPINARMLIRVNIAIITAVLGLIVAIVVYRAWPDACLEARIAHQKSLQIGGHGVPTDALLAVCGRENR